jgi:hypothetical protein
MNDSCIETLIFLKDALLNYKTCLSNDSCKEILKQVEILIKSLELKIKTDCIHDYVDDYIDIHPEKSQKICYCSICFTSFPTK